MNKYKNYLSDLGDIIKDMAIQSKTDLTKETDEKSILYKTGYLSAMHRVISLMQQQSIGFEIDLKDINLNDIKPNKDLV